jgi:hypothetical protein
VAPPPPAPDRLTRSARLVRTIVFGLAILIGLATVVVMATRHDGYRVVNPSRIFSPSGHLPGEINPDPQVSMTWTAVNGAAGYWWAMVKDPAHLPAPHIRPSGSDRSVFFLFHGKGYFVLRTATRAEGKLQWSEAFVYGPIIVRKGVIGGPNASAAPGSSAAPGGSAADESGPGPGGQGGSGGSTSRATPRPTVDPRFAGQAGSCGSNGSCGGAGQPGQPAQEPGGGSQPGRNGSNAGTPGKPGPNGGNGPP